MRSVVVRTVGDWMRAVEELAGAGAVESMRDVRLVMSDGLPVVAMTMMDSGGGPVLVLSDAEDVDGEACICEM